MEQQRGDPRQRASHERQFVARSPPVRFQFAVDDFFHSAPARIKVQDKENEAEGRANDAVFCEQVEVVVVDKNRVGLNLRRTKRAAVVEKSAAAGAGHRTQPELLERGLPHQRAHIGRVIDLGEPRGDRVALGHRENRATDQQGNPDKRGDQHRPQTIRAKPAHHPQADAAKNEQAENRTQIAAATAGNRNARNRHKCAVASEQPHPGFHPTPTADTQGHHAQHFQQTGEMVRVDVKAAGPPLPIRALNAWQKHEVVLLLELHASDHDMHQGQRQERTDHDQPVTRTEEKGIHRQVGDQRAKREEKVPARQILDRRL